MTPEEYRLILHQAARRARKHRPDWLDTNDLIQTAEVAMLEANNRGRVEHVTDPLHLSNKTRVRAFGAMLDEIKRSYREAPKNQISYDDTGHAELEHGIAPDDPARSLQLKQALERLIRKGTPQMLECIALLAEGWSTDEVALTLGVSGSRVSQIRAEARVIMELNQ